MGGLGVDQGHRTRTTRWRLFIIKLLESLGEQTPIRLDDLFSGTPSLSNCQLPTFDSNEDCQFHAQRAARAPTNRRKTKKIGRLGGPTGCIRLHGTRQMTYEQLINRLCVWTIFVPNTGSLLCVGVECLNFPFQSIDLYAQTEARAYARTFNQKVT